MNITDSDINTLRDLLDKLFESKGFNGVVKELKLLDARYEDEGVEGLLFKENEQLHWFVEDLIPNTNVLTNR